MKRLLLIGLLLALLIVPTTAIHCDFQDYAFCNFGLDGGTATNIGIGTGAEERSIRYTSAGFEMIYPSASTSNYWAVTIINGGNTANYAVRFYDSARTYQGLKNSLIAGRWEFIRDSTTGTVRAYRDASFDSSLGVFTLPTAYMDIVTSGGVTMDFDDYTNEEPGDNGVSVSTIPPNWTVVKDFSNPANSGIYAESTLIRTNYMYSYFSGGSNLTAGAKTFNLKNVATGTTYETLGTTGAYRELRNNLTYLTGVASTAPNGLYEITIDGGTGPYNYAYFWLTSTGGTIAWSTHNYYSQETATSTWSITPAYWDTTTYNYAGAIVDAYGNTKTTWTITAAAGSQTTSLDTTNYPAGVYYNKLTATLKASPYTAYILDTDYMSVTMDVKINGFTYNATTNSTFPNRFINFTQLGTVVNTTSHATYADYNKTGLFQGSAILIEPNNNLSQSNPLMWVPISFTPLSYGNFTINLYGTEDPKNMSVRASTANSTIYGLVQTSPYYNAAGGATVNIWNDSWAGTSTTANLTGFYNFTGLKAFIPYYLNASKTGYTNTTPYSANSSQTYKTVLYNASRQDLLLNRLYTMTMTFKDSSTGAIIPAVNVVDSNGYSTTTTTGTFTYYYSYSLVAFYYSATGYAASSSSYIMDSDRTVTVYLTTSTETSQTMFNSPHQVLFKVVDRYGARQDNTIVNVTPVETTIPSGNWFLAMFGLGSTTAPAINTTNMSGITGTDGSIVFTMIGSIKYNIQFTNTTRGINYLQTIYPVENEYTVWVPTTATAVATNCGLLVNSSLYVTTPTTATTYLNLSYADASLSTVNVSFFVNYPNYTNIYTTQIIGTSLNQTITNVSYPVTNTAGTMYVWGFYANTTTCGNITGTQGITLKGASGRLINLDQCNGYATSWGGASEC